MMKKVMSVVLAAMLLCMCTAPALASTVYRYVYSDNGLSVNVRDKMSVKNGSVLTQVPYGDKIILIESKGTWSRVNAHGVYGYVMSRYLVKNKPAAKEPAAADFSTFKKVKAYRVTVHPSRPGGFVNLRWSPSTKSKVIEKVYEGTKLTVIAEGKGWSQVTDPKTGAVGFMVTKYLKK